MFPLRHEFVPPDGKAAWVMRECWINTWYRLHIIAEAIQELLLLIEEGRLWNEF